MEIRLLYITCRNREEALRIGQLVIEERLAACANLIEGMTSLYRWEGALVTDQEIVLILKTSAALAAALTARVQELHSYQIPSILEIPVLGGNAAYLSWLGAELQAESLAS
jgi:periplasmic divalent cation tolerance protein